MSNLEILATFFTLICVALTVKRNIWCWPMGIIGVSAYFFVFYNHKLYADMGLQVVFLIQSIYGWHYWLNGNPEDDDNVPIRRLNLKEIGLMLASILTMLLVIGFLTDTYTDTDVAYLDAAVASTSLIANMLLARKILDNWVLWIIVDVFYVGLFYYKELYLTAGLYVIFFFMASAGFIEWRKKYQEQRLTVSSE